jgi:hypothetical protein
VDELLDKLAVHRRRIRAARVADAALRWAFHASVAACVGLLIAKLAGISLPLVAAVVVAAVPVAMAVRELTRSFSIRDCAIHLDRLLRLEERLSTALETSGSMGALLRADAGDALARTPMPSRRFPREGKLLAGTLLVLAALATIPAPGRSGAKGDPAFEAVTAEEAAKLLALAKVDVQFQEAADALKAGRPEEALAILEELKRRLASKLLEGGGGQGAAEAQKPLDQATSAAAAVSAELARLGRAVHAQPPAIAQAKLERQKAVEHAAAATGPSVAAGAAVRAVDTPWNPRYDAVILRYFGRDP